VHLEVRSNPLGNLDYFRTFFTEVALYFETCIVFGFYSGLLYHLYPAKVILTFYAPFQQLIFHFGSNLAPPPLKH
jgi:hypothetical protein